jgi:hypothetical protein
MQRRSSIARRHIYRTLLVPLLTQSQRSALADDAPEAECSATRMITADFRSLAARADLAFAKPVERSEAGLPIGFLEGR